ncbi:unnamed protein product [Mycena citricolor]|uniref:Uncharacterized protein n=1 Tax=Mycena citricolor TaxID=2018698 RepID=A0AAD2Q0P7_9AGAR|nr:unnamed protein product [Mycena citricolor]
MKFGCQTHLRRLFVPNFIYACSIVRFPFKGLPRFSDSIFQLSPSLQSCPTSLSQTVRLCLIHPPSILVRAALILLLILISAIALGTFDTMDSMCDLAPRMAQCPQTAATRAIPHTPSWPAVPLPSTYPIPILH